MNKYIIDNEIVSEQDFYDTLESTIRDSFTNDQYDELLDDAYEEVQVGGCTFSPSLVLSKCDPIAYNIGKDDWIDHEITDAKYEIEQSGSWEGYGKQFIVIYPGDDDDEEDFLPSEED